MHAEQGAGKEGALSTRLLRSTATVGGFTLCSRILGFVRDVVIATVFGAGLGADAFFIAFRIPNLLRRLFAEGAFSQAFVPVLTEHRTRQPAEEVRELIDGVAGTLAGALVLITLAGILAAPLLVALFAPGYIGEAVQFGLTVKLLRVCFPYLFLIALTALAGAILNAYGRFAVPAVTPIFLNLSLISAALWLAPRLDQPVTALAWGVLLGGTAQLLFQLPALGRLRLLPRPRIDPDSPGVRKILRLMLPALFGSSVAQVNLLVNTLIASFLATGSISWLYYSDRLVEFPLGVFGLALATVILPSLSQTHADGSSREFSATLDWALRWVVLVAVPAAAGLALLAPAMLATLFRYGEFSAFDVHMTARSLSAFALGLPGFILIRVLAPGFFARQDTRTPVRIGVAAMLGNMALSALLVWPLAHAGLALATSLSACLQAALLLNALRRRGVYACGPGWPAFLLRVFFAAAVMGVVIALGPAPFAQWLAWSAPLRAVHLALWLLAGAATYLGALWLAGLRWGHMAGTISLERCQRYN